MATRMHWGAIALVLALSATGCSDDDTDPAAAGTEGGTTTDDTTAPAFRPGECPRPIPDADGFRCGTVSVPLERADADSPTIDLAVAVLSAPEPGLHDDPVVVIRALDPALAGYEGFAALPERVERDVVLFDFRGTGGSAPTLECTELDYRITAPDTDPAVRRQFLDTLDACRRRLEADGVDLEAYTIGAIADDVVDIRRALGYDSWNVLGFGQYGPDPGLASSEIVFELMRRDGDAIRSVTMESPTPAQQDPWSLQIENLVRAIDETSAACSEQPACAAVQPSLRDHLTTAFQQPRSELAATSGEGDPMTVVFDPAWRSFYNSVGIGAVDIFPSYPSAISLPPQELADLIAATTTRPSPDASLVHGLALSVLCSQTGADTTPEDRSTPNDLGAVGFGLFVEQDACDRWTFAESGRMPDDPVISDIPTLVLVGQFDPFNTVAGARLVASTLANAHVYEVPAATANPLGHSDCARDIRNSFVQNPEQEPDTNCLRTVSPLQFAR